MKIQMHVFNFINYTNIMTYYLKVFSIVKWFIEVYIRIGNYQELINIIYRQVDKFLLIRKATESTTT
ncbi:hypothetical protein ABE28_024045 (plasmid) [Peribacillus muralis]|uniref:Uncharacterized protein n=1 Tax=Peribacillus muralis TaxID=264697 RepID=A0A1B3XW42_9BACI|nr:hypothetical protein ABE28_024045 [Peribacillus muralis]